jgi:hypothetical protein
MPDCCDSKTKTNKSSEFEYEMEDLMKEGSPQINLTWSIESILLVGEGDMNYTIAYFNKEMASNGLGSGICQMNIIATEFKSKKVLGAHCYNLWKNLKAIAQINKQLEDRGYLNRIVVIYGVDITNLYSTWKFINASETKLFQIHCNFPWYYREENCLQQHSVRQIVSRLFSFADKMLVPNGQLNLALCEYQRFYPEYGLEEALEVCGRNFMFVEKCLMSEKYTEYQHVSSQGSETYISWIKTNGYEHVYVKIDDRLAD